MREGVDGARGGHADHHEEQVGHGEVQNELRRSIESFDAACGVTAALGIFQRLSLPERSKINWPELDWTERQHQQQQRRNIYPAPQVRGVAHLPVEGDHEHDEQVAEEPDEDDDREEYGHCRASRKLIYRWGAVGTCHSEQLFLIQKLYRFGETTCSLELF